jgi:hypothetical protein
MHHILLPVRQQVDEQVFRYATNNNSPVKEQLIPNIKKPAQQQLMRLNGEIEQHNSA